MRTIEEIRTQFLDMPRPFVWALQLSEEEFSEIENYIMGFNSSEDALIVMIYVGEWYKRQYDTSENIRRKLPWFEAEWVWKNCGIRGYSQWIYESERGKEWLYSMYVLGGFAAKLECGHPDDKLLEQLCRIYHGEDVELSGAENRAIGLAQSIRQEGSIFYYIQEIIRDNLPFDSSDLINPDSDIFQFVRLLRRANRKALYEKFNCEWIITYADYYETMSRHLKVGLRPERGRSGLRQYLSYERLENWGFDNPGQIARIKVSLRFLDDGAIVHDADFSNPLLTYSNSGNDNNGFIAWNSKDSALAATIPNSFFSNVDIVIQATRIDFSTEEHTVAANADFPQFMQLYRIAKRPTEWSSRFRASDSAVIYNTACKIVFPPDVTVEKKAFYINKSELLENEPQESEPYRWTHIDNAVLIRDSFGVEKWLYNRANGYELIFNRLDDTVKYEVGGTVIHKFRPNVNSEWNEELIPILFGEHNFEIRKYREQPDDYELVQAENLKISQSGNLYNSFERLREGLIEMTVTLAGREYHRRVWFIPVKQGESAITRDFSANVIRWYDGTINNGDTESFVVNCLRGTDLSQLVINVFSPEEGHEIYIDGQPVERVGLHSDVKIPFINSSHFAVKTIDKNGVHEIEGQQLHDLYYDAPYQGDSEEIQKKAVKAGSITMYLFNPADKPIYADSVGGIKLPSYTQIVPRHYGMPKIPTSSPFSPLAPVPIIDAFEAGVKHHAYFMIFRDMKMAVKNGELIEKLFIPLVENDKLTKENIKELWRLAFEFHFDWMLLPRTQWGAVPKKWRAKIFDVFRNTPKAVNEMEQRRLEQFLESYWDFNDFTTDNPIAKTALQCILGTIKLRDPRQFIKEFDKSAIKFHEMTKTLK